jgi:hypothetical protein
LVISDLLAMLIFSRRLKISDLLAMLIFSRRLAQPLPGSSILRSSCSAVAWIIWSNSAGGRTPPGAAVRSQSLTPSGMIAVFDSVPSFEG